MLSWLLYGIVVGSLLTVGAHCVERVCQLTGRPTRWVWAGTLILTVVLIGIAPYRAGWFVQVGSPPRSNAQIHPDTEQKGIPTVEGVSRSQFVRQEIASSIQQITTLQEQHIPVSFGRYLTMAWGVLSGLTLLAFLSVYLYFRRLWTRWPVRELHGLRIRVAPEDGPAVVGLLHPEIVIPQWLLARTPEEQRVVLVHEQEHIRAGDLWLLMGACAITIVLAWHPAVWWMATRLRFAIELDCDARVLRRGITPQLYGSLLLDLAERCSGLPVRALALADSVSHLRQRLLAMKPAYPRFAAVRAGFLALCAVFLLITACAAQVPAESGRRRTAEQQMTANKYEYRIRKDKYRIANPVEWTRTYDDYVSWLNRRVSQGLYRGAVTPKDSAAMFLLTPGNSALESGGVDSSTTAVEILQRTLDGHGLDSAYASVLGQEAARNAVVPNGVRDSVLIFVDGVRRGVFPINEPLPFSQLKVKLYNLQFEIFRGGRWAVLLWGKDAANGVINVMTRNRQPGDSGILHLPPSLKEARQRVQNGATAVDKARADRKDPMVVVDGVRADPAQKSPLDQIDPNIIEKINVFKGDSAVALYGADAADGVIVVTTKKGAKRDTTRQ